MKSQGNSKVFKHVHEKKEAAGVARRRGRAKGFRGQYPRANEHREREIDR
jgi:hypothetical protein